MSSANRLDPKVVPTDSWKRWLKDSFRMWKRLGIFWQLAYPIGVSAAAVMMSQTVKAVPSLVLVVIPLSIVFGVISIPIQIRALQRARAGLNSNPWEDMSLGFIDIIQSKKWFGWHVFSIFAWSVIIMIPLMFFYMNGDTKPDTSMPDPKGLRLATTLILYGTLYTWILRVRGFWNMTYFLEIREGLDRLIASKLDVISFSRNQTCFTIGSTLLVLCSMVLIVLVPRTEFFLPIPVISAWIFAGVNLNAWHDIFDPDEGLLDRQRAQVFTGGKLIEA